MLSSFEIELPSNQDPAAFLAFMQDEYLPAIHMGPTRVGQIEEIRLLREEVEGEGATSADAGNRFLLLVTWSGTQLYNGGRPKDEAVLQKFEKLGATVNEAAWRETARLP